MAETKVCKTCKNIKPLAAFSSSSLARDGKDTRCRPCNAKRARERRQPEAIARRKDLAEFKAANPNLKKCADCKKFKDVTDFYIIRKSNRTTPYCKPCTSERAHKINKKNRAKLSEYNKARYVKQRESRIQYARKYRQEKADQVRLVNKRWRENNRDKESSYTSRKRARKRSGVWEYYDRQFVFDRDNGICCICFTLIDITLKCPDKMSFTVQHLMPLSLGGSDILDNVSPAHFSCNSRVGNRKIMSRAN